MGSRPQAPDRTTIEYITSILEKRRGKDRIEDINTIHNKFKEYDTTPLTLEITKLLYKDIETVFYPGLSEFLSGFNINFINLEESCVAMDTTGSVFLATTQYDEGDDEYDNYRYAFTVALTCLNEHTFGEKIYYSGGYITRSRVIFLILMFLHEIIHLIEFTDSYIQNAPADHTVFFYRVGLLLYGQLTRYSEVFNNDTSLLFETKIKKKLVNADILRINDIKELESYDPNLDGETLLGDSTEKGYITHSSSKDTSGVLKMIEDLNTSSAQTNEPTNATASRNNRKGSGRNTATGSVAPNTNTATQGRRSRRFAKKTNVNPNATGNISRGGTRKRYKVARHRNKMRAHSFTSSLRK